MDLSRICINPRLRGSWEAVDLGFVIARRWYFPLLLIWGLTCLPVALLCFFLFSEHLWVAVVVVWWCKPFLDRLPLVYLSQAIFSEPVQLSALFKRLPEMWKIQWLQWLTLWRFNFSRSFDMPVTVLERLVAKPREGRLSVLHRHNTGAAIWLTMVCFSFEVLFVVGCFALFAILTPEQISLAWSDLAGDDSQYIQWVDFFLYCIAMMVIAPLYIASGFALYISRRIELEAWDVELRFRHLSERHAKKTKPNLSTSLILLLTSSLFICGNPADVIASEDLAEDPQHLLIAGDFEIQIDSVQQVAVNDSAQAKVLIEQVLANDDFHVMEEVTRWRLKPFEASIGSVQLPEWFITMVEWIEALLFYHEEPKEIEEFDTSTLALIIEIIIWCVAVLVIVTCIYIYRRHIHELINRIVAKKPEVEHKPKVLFGLEVSQDSLPDDIPTQVKQLCISGDFRQALSLLYRATLSGLMHQYDFTFYDSYTEGECIQVVSAGGESSLSEFTKDVTLFWQQLAYGHQQPISTEVDQLCGRWQELFDHEK